MSDQITEVKSAVEAINVALKARKDAETAQATEIKNLGAATAETKEKLDKIQTELGRLDDIKSQLERVEKLASRPVSVTKSDDPHFELNQKHMNAFTKLIRNRKDPDAHAELFRVEKEAIQVGAVKAVSVGTPAAGGYALPEQISREIDRLAVELSPMRMLAKVITVGTTDYKHLVDILGTGYGWVGETGSRTETTTPGLAEVAPTFGTIYAYPKATEESLNDLFFDVGAWLTQGIVEGFDLGEGIAFHNGNGTNKPTGMLAGSTSSSGDDDSPARAFGTIQHIATGKAADFDETPYESPAASGQDVFISTVYALRNRYLRNASWMMNKNTLSRVRKMKDNTGEYIWQPGLQAGQPSTLVGYPVYENPNFANVGSNALVASFGDYSQAYLICNLVGLRISVDDNVTTPGYVKWYARRRVGGKLIKDEAVKVIKCATS